MRHRHDAQPVTVTDARVIIKPAQRVHCRPIGSPPVAGSAGRMKGMTEEHTVANGTERRSSANMERHIQTILISVITGALMFAANYFYNDNRSKAVQQTQLEVLTAQVIEMRADLRSMQNTYVRREELKEMELRMRDVERRLGGSTLR